MIRRAILVYTEDESRGTDLVRLLRGTPGTDAYWYNHPEWLVSTLQLHRPDLILIDLGPWISKVEHIANKHRVPTLILPGGVMMRMIQARIDLNAAVDDATKGAAR